MRLYGYKEVDDEGGEAMSPMELGEVTFVADATTLRSLSKFFAYAAGLLEQHRENFGHEHFEDFDRTYRGNPRVVVSGAPQSNSLLPETSNPSIDS